MTQPSDRPDHQRRNLLLLGLAIVALVFAAWYFRAPPDYAGEHMSVTEAHALAQDGAIVLVDIRRPDEWRRTGIGEGAHPIDMRRDDFVTALAQVAGPDRSAKVALICARGVRSARLSNRLTREGFTNIIDVGEGMEGSAAGPGWLDTGLPVMPWNGQTP